MARYDSITKGAPVNATEDQSNIYSSRQDYEFLSDALADVTARLGDRFTVGNFSALQLSGLLAFEWVASGTGGEFHPHDTLSLVAELKPSKIITDEMFGGDSVAAQAYVAANSGFVYIDDVINPPSSGGTLGGAVTAGDTYSILLLDETRGGSATNINLSSTYAAISTSDLKGTKHHFVDLRNTTCCVLNSGTVRVSFAHESSSGTEVRARILKNGVEVQEWSTTSKTPVAATVDVSVSYGDYITLQHRRATSSGGSYVTAFKISANEDNLTVV